MGSAKLIVLTNYVLPRGHKNSAAPANLQLALSLCDKKLCAFFQRWELQIPELFSAELQIRQNCVHLVASEQSSKPILHKPHLLTIIGRRLAIPFSKRRWKRLPLSKRVCQNVVSREKEFQTIQFLAALIRRIGYLQRWKLKNSLHLLMRLYFDTPSTVFLWLQANKVRSPSYISLTYSLLLGEGLQFHFQKDAEGVSTQ